LILRAIQCKLGSGQGLKWLHLLKRTLQPSWSIDTSVPPGRVAFDIVLGTKCPEFPNGNARIAMKRLKQKYAPTTAFALSTIYKKYVASKLRKGHDLDVFITYLQDHHMSMAEMNQVVDDKAFVLHILANLGDDYELVQFHLDHRMFSTINPISIEELCHQQNNCYDKIKYKYNQNTDNPSNTPRPQGQE
jgi:gag-polypeptide of LTR copia-type